MVAPPQSTPLLLELPTLLEDAGPEDGPDVPPMLDEPDEPGGTVLPVEDCGALDELAALELSTVDPCEDDVMADDDPAAELDEPATDDDVLADEEARLLAGTEDASDDARDEARELLPAALVATLEDATPDDDDDDEEPPWAGSTQTPCSHAAASPQSALLAHLAVRQPAWATTPPRTQHNAASCFCCRTTPR